MANPSRICGTSAVAPIPSDPSDALQIFANTTRDGVKITWTFPAINSHAVAFYRLVRSATAEFNDGTLLVATAADQYYDVVEEDQVGNTYYYWVQHVSISGTESSFYGPAIAIAGNWIAKVVEAIGEEIKASNLAESLRTEIESIPTLRAQILDEKTNRLAAIEDIEFSLQDVNLNVSEVRNNLINDATQTSAGLQQLASDIEGVDVSNGQNAAQIIQERLARVDAISAEATLREQLAVETANNAAAIINEASARSSEIAAEASARELLQTQTTTALNNNVALITAEATARTNAISAETQAREALAVQTNDNKALIESETSARTNAISAEAQAREALGVRTTNAEADIISNKEIAANETGAVATELSQLATVAINSFRQNSPPTEAQGRKVGSLWTDTNNGNVTTQWNGTAWAPLENQVAIDAFSAVQSIQQSITDGDFALATDFTTLEASVTVAGGEVYDRITGVDTKAGNAATAANTADGKAVNAQTDANTALTQSAPTTIDARVEDKLIAQVGFCLINGSPDSSYDNQTDCEAQSGATWVPLAALAEAVRGIEIVTPNGTTKIQDRMQAYDTGLDDLDELDTGIKAEYTLKIDTDTASGNKIIGGFGLALEDDDTINAGFNVDKFWIGKVTDTYASENVPFVVDSNDGKVYIKSAMIAEASIGIAQIIDLSVSVAKIQDLAVTTAKIDNLAIKEAKIANAAITRAKIEDLAVTGAKIDDATITSANIGNGQIKSAHIGFLEVETANIQIGAINAARIGTAAVDTLRIKGRAITSNRYTRSTSVRTWNDGVGWDATPVWLYVTMDDIGVGNTETIPVVLSLDYGWAANRKNNVPPAVNVHDIDIEYQYRDLSTGSFVYSALQYATVGTVGFDSQNVVSHGLSSSAVRLQIPSYSQLRFRLRRDRQAAWTSTSDTDAQMQDFKIFLTVLIASMNFR